MNVIKIYVISSRCLRSHFNDLPNHRQHHTVINEQSINPGLVDTDFLDTFDPVLRSFLPKLTADDVRDAVVYALGTPDHVRVITDL